MGNHHPEWLGRLLNNILTEPVVSQSFVNPEMPVLGSAKTFRCDVFIACTLSVFTESNEDFALYRKQVKARMKLLLRRVVGHTVIQLWHCGINSFKCKFNHLLFLCDQHYMTIIYYKQKSSLAFLTPKDGLCLFAKENYSEMKHPPPPDPHLSLFCTNPQTVFLSL